MQWAKTYEGKWRSEEELNGSCKSWIELAYAKSCTVTQNTSMHVLKAASGRTQDRKAAPGLALAQAKEPCLGCIQGVHPPRFIETPLCPFKAWSKPWSNSVRPWGGAPSPFYRGSPPPPSPVPLPGWCSYVLFLWYKLLQKRGAAPPRQAWFPLQSPKALPWLAIM